MARWPVGSVTPRRAQAAAAWQSRVRARVSPSRLPGTARFRGGRHLMAKVQETTGAGSEAGADLWAAPRHRPPHVGPSQSAATFSQASDRVLHGRGGSRDTARLRALHLTRLPKWPSGPVCSQPLPLSRWLSASPSPRREMGEMEGGDGQWAPAVAAHSRAPGKCLNNRTVATALVSPGCGKVGCCCCCCNWSCSLRLPVALSAAQQKPQPEPPEPASGLPPPTLPFLLSTPAVARNLGSSRLRPKATAPASPAAACA